MLLGNMTSKNLRQIYKLFNSMYWNKYSRCASTFRIYSKPVLYTINYIHKELVHNMNQNKMFSNLSEEEFMDHSVYEKVCEETLDSLAEFFEELVETEDIFQTGDVSYGAGVLTIDLGKFGTYVINRQSPNKQIWLSSPTSGPKRYDYSIQRDCWIYKHDGNTLHHLLKSEFELILDKHIDMLKCNHSNM